MRFNLKFTWRRAAFAVETNRKIYRKNGIQFNEMCVEPIINWRECEWHHHSQPSYHKLNMNTILKVSIFGMDRCIQTIQPIDIISNIKLHSPNSCMWYCIVDRSAYYIGATRFITCNRRPLLRYSNNHIKRLPVHFNFVSK